MPRRTDTSFIPILGAITLLTGCATPRLYSEAELNSVGSRCGLAAGELVQEADFKKMLFVYRVAPSPAERVCAYQWARARHLRLTVIEAVTRAGQ
ncbi:hypothetical protein [Sphingomonas sp.]|uniref:hypothetical protein n=1 Tax=Sphingomonas sp. TaxID=28214 RepID=UPI00286ADDDA|nr:hypothetical protein [Sphingomonas sp.]